jgi:hypothetical protein
MKDDALLFIGSTRGVPKWKNLQKCGWQNCAMYLCLRRKQAPGTVTAFTFSGGVRQVAGRTIRELCFVSQTAFVCRRYSRAMSAKYYTQFRLTDANYRGGNEFSGVIELSRPVSTNSDVADIEAVLARNFDLQKSAVKLLSWARLH